jgi:hypothetical protein
MKNVFLTFVCLAVVACANQACKIEERKDIVMTGNEKTTSQKKDLTSRVFIYKLDGSLQCEQGKRISADTMKKELDGIEGKQTRRNDANSGVRSPYRICKCL